MSLSCRLTLARWLSPAFPVGSFAYSGGLETAMAAGDVADAAAVEAWIAASLCRGAGFAELCLMLAARRAEDPDEVAAHARSLAPSRERLRETEELGRAFAETVSATGLDIPHMPYPVALGLAVRTLALSDAEVAAHMAQAYAAMLTSAAVRFIPLGQSTGQGMLRRLAPEAEAAAERAASMEAPLAFSLAGFAADLASMEHETLEPRIFVT